MSVITASCRLHDSGGLGLHVTLVLHSLQGVAQACHMIDAQQTLVGRMNIENEAIYGCVSPLSFFLTTAFKFCL